MYENSEDTEWRLPQAVTKKWRPSQLYLPTPIDCSTEDNCCYFVLFVFKSFKSVFPGLPVTILTEKIPSGYSDDFLKKYTEQAIAPDAARFSILSLSKTKIFQKKVRPVGIQSKRSTGCFLQSFLSSRKTLFRNLVVLNTTAKTLH